jgi:hypothetical protein
MWYTCMKILRGNLGFLEELSGVERNYDIIISHRRKSEHREEAQTVGVTSELYAD